MNIYTGSFDNENWYQIFKNSEPFDPRPSLEVRNHSPTGFAFGYSGSGPAQLALGILLEEFHDKERALELYQDFKAEVIAGLPNHEGSYWTLTSEQVSAWLEVVTGH